MLSPDVPNELRWAPRSRPVETLRKAPKRTNIRSVYRHHQDVRWTALAPLRPELQKRTKKGTPSVADATTSAAAQAPHASAPSTSRETLFFFSLLFPSMSGGAPASSGPPEHVRNKQDKAYKGSPVKARASSTASRSHKTHYANQGTSTCTGA